MAKKKQKNDIFQSGQPGLFDLYDDPIAEFPVHPSIDEFIVSAPEQKEEKTVPVQSDFEEFLPVVSESKSSEAILFMSLGSGSSGNCSFVGSLGSGGFLIDAGVDEKTVAESLLRIGITMDQIHGICLTHDHSDHVRFVYTLVRRNPHLRIYCTPKILTGILRRHNISRRIRDYHKPIYKEFPFKIDGAEGFDITAFDVSHDGTDNCGFYITYGKGNFTVATDLGCITPRVDFYMRKANFIMIEANYDSFMLKTGRYPAYLKARIAAENGHLDNEITAAFLREILSKRLTDVFLCHLSQDNNKAEIALSNVLNALSAHEEILNGTIALPQVSVLPRYGCSKLFTLRNLEK